MQKQLVGAVVGLCLAYGGVARAGDFFDTRLSFVFADDNVLKGAGETTPNSPNARFGAGSQNTQFYDNFNTRFSGFESLSHIVLYKRSAAFFEGLETEAALSALLLERTNGGIELRDDSSYVRLNYTPPAWAPKETISLTGFPVSADRFRLGYAYRLTWGGCNRTECIFTRGAEAAPGAKLQVTRDRWYAYLGAKTALLQNRLIQEEETNYGFLGGAGIDVLETLRVEASGGYFQKGTVPGLADVGIRAPVNAAGLSAQAVYHVGEPVGTSVDLTLYRNDPEETQRFFRPERYPGGLSYTVSLEGSALVQTLQDPDAAARTEPQWASAAALIGRIKLDYMRAHLLAVYRSVTHILFNVPGFPPFANFPTNTRVQPEMFVALGADYHFPALHLTPGLIVGIQQPAAVTSPTTLIGGNNPPAAFTGGRTVVVRDQANFSILGPDDSPVPIISAKTTFRWDLSETVATIGEVYYTYDDNRVTFRDDAFGVAQPTYEDPNGLGFNLMVQAKF